MNATAADNSISIIVCDDSGMPSKSNAPEISGEDVAKWENQFNELDAKLGINS